MITCLSVWGGADVFCPALVMYMLIAQGMSNALTAAKHTSAISGMKPPKRRYRSNRKSCSIMKCLLQVYNSRAVKWNQYYLRC